MSGPFVCPHCGSMNLSMGYYIEEDAPCFLRCLSCGFTENFPRKIMDVPAGSSERSFIFAVSVFCHD